MIISDKNRDEDQLDDSVVPHSNDTPRPVIPFRFGLRMAIVSGLLLWLAHPSPGLWALAWIGLVPLIISVQKAKSPRQAAVRGYMFGWAYLAPTWYWTGLTIVGWTGSQIGWAALFLLTLLAALFYALWAAAAWWISRQASGAWRVIGIASAWVVMEWLRSVGSLSVPWAQVCYTQYKALPIIQIAEVTGALGVSFLLLLVNASIVEWWQYRQQPQSRRWLLSSVTLIGLLSLCGLVRMVQLGDGRPVTVAIMQGNFDYKNSTNLTGQKLSTFESLTEAANRTSRPVPELYVWAESAAPGDALHDTWSRNAMQALADRYKASVLTGARIVDGDIETNSALLFSPGEPMPQRFDKMGVVPFGEYIPFRAQVPDSIQKQFQFFESDISPGRSLSPMHLYTAEAGPVLIGPFICYESVYPHYTRTMTARGASLLVTPSHDQWFQSEAAMEQHLAIVVFRAIENRRDVARATTDGVSAAIDGRGRIVARSPLYTAYFLVKQLHLRTLLTLYTRFGDWFIGLCAILIAIACTSKQASKWAERTFRASKKQINLQDAPGQGA